MIGNATVRVYVVVGLIAVTYLVGHKAPSLLRPSEVAMPSWTFDEMPLNLANWRGEPTKMDPEIAVATGADRIVNRAYKDDLGHVVAVHTAVFKSADAGVYHSPLNCYQSQGWQQIKRTTERLQLADGLTIPVSVSTWERDQDRVIVIYWYQLGEHVLFGRADFGLRVRWSLRNRPKWPAMIKVMLQIPATDLDDAKSAILSFAREIATWENLPEHRKEALSFDKAEKDR